MTTLAYPYLRYSSAGQKHGDSERRQGEWFAAEHLVDAPLVHADAQADDS